MITLGEDEDLDDFEDGRRGDGPTLDIETVGADQIDALLLDVRDSLDGIRAVLAKMPESVRETLDRVASSQDRLAISQDRLAAALSSFAALEHERAAADHERAARAERAEDLHQRLAGRSLTLASQALTSPLWWAAIGPLIGWFASSLVPPADVAEAVGAPPPPSAIVAPGTPEEEE